MTIDVDAAYAHTRRRGKPGTVTIVGDSTADPKTGTRTTQKVTHKVRWMVKQRTEYSRWIRAEATQQRMGETTFVIRLKDVQDHFTEVDQEDYITWNNDGKRYEVVSTDEEDGALLIFAREVR
jgi:hypothetical protein